MKRKIVAFAIGFMLGVTIINRSQAVRNDWNEPITPIAKITSPNNYKGEVVIKGYLFHQGYGYRIGNTPILLQHPMDLESMLGRRVEAKATRLSIIGEYLYSVTEVKRLYEI